jgi:ABC-type sugar transport system substrate-binding protein
MLAFVLPRRGRNKVAATLVDAIEQYLLVMRAMSSAIMILSVWTIAARAADSVTQGETVAFLPGVMGNAFYVTMECGIRAEAAKYGFKIDIQGPQQFDPTLQTPIVNAAWRRSLPVCRPTPRRCSSRSLRL